MNKYLLVLGCSLTVFGMATNASAENQLDAIRDLYVKEFQNMDIDNDGQISQEEYLSYQFNSLRNNIVKADNFDETETTAQIQAKQTETITDGATVGVPSAMQDMANFDFEMGDSSTEETPEQVTKEDVIPQAASSADTNDLDLSISEDENFQKLVAGENVVQEAPVKEENSALMSENQMTAMLDTIKKTLPKKIDEITTWVDITYEDGVIDYVYQAELDMTSYNDDELSVLKQNIQNEACTKAYTDMCPRIRPMFIDRGIDMRIIYLDKNNENISSCEFNKTTCAE